MRAAVRESLIDDGFEGTTIPSVAKRAGVGAPTLYRRWPTQIELVEALFDDLVPGELEVPSDPADFSFVVHQVVEGSFQFFGHPAARRAVPGLLAAYNGDPSRYAALTSRIEVPARKMFRKVHANALRQHRVTKKPDPERLFSIISGSSLYLAGVRGETDHNAKRSIIDVVLKSCRP